METKKINWWGLLLGILVLGAGVFLLVDSIGRNTSEVNSNGSQNGSVYYGTYIGDQYIYEGLQDAIQKNFDWNKNHLTDGQYIVTNVCYKGEILIQILPGPYGNLSIYVKVPTSKMSTFKSINSYASFIESNVTEEYVAVCHEDVNMAQKITSDVLEHFYNVPRSGKLTFCE